MKNNKPAGYDGLVAELIKYGGKELHKRIHELIEEIWIKEEMPRECKIGVITPELMKEEEAKLSVFERKVIRTIIGPKVTEDEEIRILMNYEIDQILKHENIVRFCKAQRIRWYGHIFRKTRDDAIKILTEWKPTETRPRGKPRSRWRKQLEIDIKEVNVGNRNKSRNNRKEKKRIWTDPPVKRTARIRKDSYYFT